ncbi:exocyst complex component 7-like [Amphibalanus amphitrite]|uniref:exocyst complex component 7-like n=1 Tax=Amphibalanus amphitrite TaxID=1232801 RepID=UPI001C90F17B|nr:exocyst complex component 7-like [Amphibalanus amphitrite]XP_043201380.1 exocyst complex component 7-like [Amphibalanus amphitrite]XP_043201382.1 exocyst complex component 7-like [Amphibalanus amphitrite]
MEVADTSVPGNVHSEKLQKELARMAKVREVLAASDQLTHGMTSILDSFERRLASLEQTVLPVYHETGNLQRRKQNIEKTLSRFDHVISYYNVSKEVDPIIRNGPGATNTETYLMAMARLQDALTFFQSNNSQSVELENVMLLFTSGMELLNKEFNDLVSKYSKQLQPVAVLDLLDRDDGQGPPSETYTFDIPENVMVDVRLIANWLSNHNSDGYMTTYARLRAGILVRTIQALQKHHKSRSNASAKSSDTQSPAALSQLSRSRADLTPTGAARSSRAPRRIASRLEKKANRMLQRAHKSLAQAGVQLGSGTPRSQLDHLEDLIDEHEVEAYLTTTSALLRLFSYELTQLTPLVPQNQLKKVFQTIIQDALDLVVKDGEAMAGKARRSIARQDFAPVLNLFPLVSHLMAMRGEFERSLQGCDPSVRNRISGIIDVLHQTCVKSLDDFMEWVLNDPDRQLPRDGTVHQRTSNVIMFCDQLVEYTDTVGWMLCQHSNYDIVTTSKVDKNKALLGVYIKKVLNALSQSLLATSEQYSDPYLRSVFRLNNYHYVLKCTQHSGLLDLVSLSEPTAEATYNSLIMEQKRLYSQSWSRVLQAMTFAEDIPSFRLDIDKLSDKEKQTIKEKFATFNREMEELCKVQREYSLPDVQLRESLKRDNKEFVLPKYTSFYDKYGSVTFSKNKDKYVKYTPAQISAMIDSFFDTAA